MALKTFTQLPTFHTINWKLFSIAQKLPKNLTQILGQKHIFSNNVPLIKDDETFYIHIKIEALFKRILLISSDILKKTVKGNLMSAQNIAIK